MSTTEAEYIAVTEVVKEAIWLRGLVEDLDLNKGVNTVFCDSQSAIHLTNHQMYHERTKQMSGITLFEKLKSSKLKKITSANNSTDMMTKSIPSHKFEHCLELLGVQTGKG